jgi:hypothetical protein
MVLTSEYTSEMPTATRRRMRRLFIVAVPAVPYALVG